MKSRVACRKLSSSLNGEIDKLRATQCTARIVQRHLRCRACQLRQKGRVFLVVDEKKRKKREEKEKKERLSEGHGVVTEGQGGSGTVSFLYSYKPASAKRLQPKQAVWAFGRIM